MEEDRTGCHDFEENGIMLLNLLNACVIEGEGIARKPCHLIGNTLPSVCNLRIHGFPVASVFLYQS